MTARTSSAEELCFPPVIEHAQARGRIVLVCEHASSAIPARWGNLGLSDGQRLAHIAWDPGALDLARALSARLDATLVHAPVSRLVHDLNRAPDRPGAMPRRSEVHDIPGNADLPVAERRLRVQAVYLPFHAALHALIAGRIAEGRAPVMVTIHSFTPVFHGRLRSVEFGVIHDADPGLARAILAGAKAATGLDCRLNQPYSAADDVTHTLRLHATPYGLPNAMLEIRNDLIANAADCESMAARLAPVIGRAVKDLALNRAEPA